MLEKKEIPFSQYMEFQWWAASYGIIFLVTFIGASAFVAFVATIFEAPAAVPYVLLGIFGVAVLIVWWYRKQEQPFIEKNQEDFEKALEILRGRDEFFAQPPNLFEVTHPQVREENGWRPIRVEYQLDQALKAELVGTMSGTFAGLFVGVFRGTVEGDITGASTPKLFDESTFVLLQKGDQVLRLISPSVETARGITFQVLDRLLDTYGKGSYSWQAVRSIGWGQNVLVDSEGKKVYSDRGERVGKLLEVEEINPSYIHDRLAASLAKPFEERPAVNIQGIFLKEGVMLGCTAALPGEKPKVLFPLEFIQQLSVRLAPLAQKELMPKEPVRLLS